MIINVSSQPDLMNWRSSCNSFFFPPKFTTKIDPLFDPYHSTSEFFNYFPLKNTNIMAVIRGPSNLEEILKQILKKKNLDKTRKTFTSFHFQPGINGGDEGISNCRQKCYLNWLSGEILCTLYDLHTFTFTVQICTTNITTRPFFLSIWFYILTSVLRLKLTDWLTS